MGQGIEHSTELVDVLRASEPPSRFSCESVLGVAQIIVMWVKVMNEEKERTPIDGHFFETLDRLVGDAVCRDMVVTARFTFEVAVEPLPKAE